MTAQESLIKFLHHRVDRLSVENRKLNEKNQKLREENNRLKRSIKYKPSL